MKFSTSILSAALAVTALASPTPTKDLEKRATTMCDSWGTVATGGFTLYQNNWGAAAASSGSQCTTFTSLTSAKSVVWSTTWTWKGGAGHVKSYSNVALEKVNKQISAIKSIPTTWIWRYSGSGKESMVADVSYDLWLAPSVGANNKYEIMIWLGSYGGAFPITSTGKTVGTPTIAGTKWNLYKGPNGDTTVFSFVAPGNIGDFSGDLKAFFTYLTTSQGVPSNYVVTSLQAGTEPFSGTDCVFKTSKYTLSVQ